MSVEEGLGIGRSYLGDDRGAEGDVVHEHAVHHVEVDLVDIAHHSIDLIFQMQEVRIEY